MAFSQFPVRWLNLHCGTSVELQSRPEFLGTPSITSTKIIASIKEVLYILQGPLAKPGSDRIGSDRIGSDRIGSDRTGPDWMGSDRIGSDRQNPDWFNIKIPANRQSRLLSTFTGVLPEKSSYSR